MLTLKTPTGPYSLRLPYDVTVTVKPLNTAGMSAAQADARRQVERLLEDARERKASGLPLGDAPDPDDAASRDGLFQDALIRALGVRHVIAWEGVGDADGPAPVTPENVAAVLALFPVGERFYQEFTLRQVLLNAAKNASGPSADGTSGRAEGRATADPAQTTARLVPAAASD